ncbi:glycosyltransferase family 2 protein [Parapedobacter sp. ISTM3]|uniref:glycosyltransferase family 2 protein n=1 Tax=Parapedobacter sp. ISTM3 TaxID=2800130 RepID=UPI0019041534|nr:glycosyltransferase family 2 protein [Parapedobacter sp. ISTM3]MBK1439223.1 glycosyltransferase family 2 protein [Parapedobacter sp. ISTM3]
MVSIITVNYHQNSMTIDLLRSIRAYAGPDVEVIVVDNGSTEDYGDLFRAEYSNLIYIRSEKNLGFAGGNNLGIKQAKGDYLLFLNNDTEITAGFIFSMRGEIERHADIGLLSPLILYFDDKRKIQYAGYTPINYFTGRNKGLGVMEDDQGQYDHTTNETGYCHGAAMMCRKTDLDRVGLMEEHFFLYYEELDWCEKFKRAGLKMAFTGKAKIYHKESMSVGKVSPLKTYFLMRNRWLFIRRNAPLLARFFFSCYYLLIPTPVAIIRYLAKGRIDLAKAALKGVMWNITHATKSNDLGIKLPTT